MAGGLYDVIVAGTDGSDTALRAVEHAARLAVATGARLELVSAYTPAPERRLRREAQDAPEDVRWMINPHEDAEAALCRGGRGGREI